MTRNSCGTVPEFVTWKVTGPWATADWSTVPENSRSVTFTVERESGPLQATKARAPAQTRASTVKARTLDRLFICVLRWRLRGARDLRYTGPRARLRRRIDIETSLGREMPPLAGGKGASRLPAAGGQFQPTARD